MERTRYLIVNADDFGRSCGVNRGVMRAHEHGIVTSASLMVRWPAAVDAAAAARAHPDLSLGLHLDLGEWVFDGVWTPTSQVVPDDDLAAVTREVEHQLALFRRLTGRNPTHLDSHQHVHRAEPLRTVLQHLAGRLSVPLRQHDPAIRYCGDFYGQTATGEPLPGRISVASLTGILCTLEPGVTELGCHPGDVDDLQSVYCAERAEEIRVLCDPRIGEAVRNHGIVLCSFGDRKWTTVHRDRTHQEAESPAGWGVGDRAKDE